MTTDVKDVRKWVMWMGTWEKRVLGRGKRKCKSPKTLVAGAE